ncbi:MAG TPA: TonB-dependent receptor [Terriglobales bacterium]|nr:TonB-dependent receptor [Terriglobales bacterium]
MLSGKSTTIIKSLMVLALSLALSAVSFAQIKSASIVGRVTDTSGAAVPAATVSAINQQTSVVSSATTDPTGNFAIPYLEPGTYNVNVEKTGSGFAKYSTVNLSLSTAQTVKLEIPLQIQTGTQTVTVSADQAVIQTSSATVQNNVNERTIDIVPNITHNAFAYAALQPGVVPRGLFGNTQNTQSFGIGIDGRRQASAIGINGGSAFSNDILLDGVSIQGSAWNETAVLPNQDALQEVKTVTNDYSAEYGRAQGVVIFTTKSGGNDYHGSAHYRVRNEDFNANSFSNNAQNIPRGAFKSNTFGGNLGGRIIKDKAFFFVSYEGLRFHRAYDYLDTVPTAAERAGDFSQTYVTVNNKAVPILLFNPFGPVTPSGAFFKRTQFPTFMDAQGVVRTSPLTAIDPFGSAILNAYPLPNRTPDDIFNTHNFFFRGNQQFNKDDINSRMDYHWGKHNFYTTYGFQKGNIATPTTWGSGNPYYSQKEFVGNQQPDNNFYVAIGDTIPLTTNIVMDARLGVNRIEADDLAASIPNYNYNQFGIPAAIQALNVIPGAPPATPALGNVTALSNGTSLHKRERQTNTDFNASMTWTRGRWTHKFGGTYRMLLSNYIDVDDSSQIQTTADFTRQNINADGSTTNLPSTASNLNGLSMASLLLGAGNIHISPGFQLRLALAQKYYALYSQNDWRATDKLTLNLGLRWDVQPGPTERHDRLTAIDLDGKDPLFGTPGAIVFPGHNGADRHMWRTRYNNFGPRLGAAYQLTQSAVVRAGYGVTYVPSNTGFNDGPGFYGAAPYTPSVVSSPYGPAPAGQVVGPFYSLGSNAVNQIVSPIGANPTNPALYGGARRFPDDLRNGFVQQWNLFLEQKIGANWNFSVGYIGSHGRNLQVVFTPINSTQLIDPGQLQIWRNQYIASNGKNPATAQICNPFQTLQTCNPASPATATGPLIPYGVGNIRNRTIQAQEALFPYPLEGDNITRSTGVSDYNALQLQVTHNFSSGLQLNANYTWSKQIADTRFNAQTNQGYSDGADHAYFPYLRPDMKHLNRQITTNDVPHRVSVNWVYDLPFGQGGRFFNTRSWVDTLIGGWRLGSVFTAQTGFVFPLASGGTNSLNSLPDRVAGVPIEVPKNLQHWYDGKTSVTLPSGRVITPCANCFLKYNIDAFTARVVTGADGKTILPDVFWYGSASPTFSDMRSNPTWNMNMSLEKNFRIRERYSFSISGQATNLFNNTQFKPGLNATFGPTVVTSNLATSGGAKIGQLQDNNSATSTFGTYTRNTYDARQLEMVVQFKF